MARLRGADSVQWSKKKRIKTFIPVPFMWQLRDLCPNQNQIYKVVLNSVYKIAVVSVDNLCLCCLCVFWCCPEWQQQLSCNTRTVRVQVGVCLVMTSPASQRAVVCTSVGTYMYVSYLAGTFHSGLLLLRLFIVLQKHTALLKRRGWLEVEGNNIWTWLATCWSVFLPALDHLSVPFYPFCSGKWNYHWLEFKQPLKHEQVMLFFYCINLLQRQECFCHFIRKLSWT